MPYFLKYGQVLLEKLQPLKGLNQKQTYYKVSFVALINVFLFSRCSYFARLLPVSEHAFIWRL